MSSDKISMFGGVNYSEEQAGITYKPPLLNLAPARCWLQRQSVDPTLLFGLRALRRLIYHTQMYVISLAPEQPSAAVKSQISEAGQTEVRAPSAILPDR